MSDLLLPPKVRREIQKTKWEQQRAEQRAVAARLLDFEDPVCQEWRPVLERLDPYLRLARARPQAYEPGFSVIPGFYHWVRDNPTAPMTVAPITGPDGESFAEPDSSLLNDLQANDLQNPRVMAALIARGEQQEAAQEARVQEERERMNSEVLERWKAASETQVSLNRDTPWSQNASPTARRDAAERRQP